MMSRPIVIVFYLAAMIVAELRFVKSNTMTWSYKEQHPFESRLGESARIRSRYPDRVPTIVQKDPNSSLKDIDREKMFVPSDLTVAEFTNIIRGRIALNPEDPLYLFVSDALHVPTTSASMGSIYEEYKDGDGFLYIAYSGDNALHLPE